MASVVFKVKFEDTLRRFNVSVNGDGLDLNMEGLRLMVHSLFNLPLSENLILTYRDEDDDLVTLVDDEDLRDVVKQGLNPVRITVHLKTDKSSQTCAMSGGSSAPLGSSLQNSQRNINPDVAEVLNSIPDPLRHTFSKLCLELTSKAASASPILGDLVDGLSKTGQSYLNASHSHSGTTNVGRRDEVFDDSIEASIDEKMKSHGIQMCSSVQPAPQNTKTTRDAEPLTIRPPLSSPSLCHKGKNVNFEPFSFKSSTSGGTKKNKEVTEDFARKCAVRLHNVNYCKAKLKKETSERMSSDNRRKFRFGGCSTKSYFDSTIGDERPIFGGSVPTDQMLPCDQTFLHDQLLNRPPIRPRNGNFNKANGMDSGFHKGVFCDGCGTFPITGPRFKSIVKDDYDLCSICFGQMGNDVDYIRVDSPMPCRHPLSFSVYDRKVPHRPPLRVPYNMMPPVPKPRRHRLDSQFAMDVSVIDGTRMAPSTPFTKIWRMHNNGTLPWHRGLKLLWIGGDFFSTSDSVEMELPINGVDVGNNSEIAVDFIAPELPGQYTSFWSMADPSGRKFGQAVWVQIQVDASADLTSASSPGLNLNLNPENNEISNPNFPDVNVEPAVDVEAGDPISQLVEEQHKTEIENLKFPINDDLLVVSDVICPNSGEASSSAPPGVSADKPASPVASAVSYPDVDAKPAAAPPSASYPAVGLFEGSSTSSNAKDDENKVEQDSGEDGVDETLLKEFEELGFKPIDLNKEIPGMNDYDLQTSVDDLSDVSEWDPILEELKEMGFEDKDTNKKLLHKNNGSLTRVVLHLISGEDEA